MNVIAKLKVNPKTGKVIPVKGKDYSIKDKTFRLRIFHENRITHADVKADSREKAIETLKQANFCFAG